MSRSRSGSASVAVSSSDASPRTTRVPGQLAWVSDREKTSFGFSFIRDVITGSFTRACGVGQ